MLGYYECLHISVSFSCFTAEETENELSKLISFGVTIFLLFAFILMLLILSRFFYHIMTSTMQFYTAMQYVKVMGQASFVDIDAFRL